MVYLKGSLKVNLMNRLFQVGKENQQEKRVNVLGLESVTIMMEQGSRQVGMALGQKLRAYI